MFILKALIFLLSQVCLCLSPDIDLDLNERSFMLNINQLIYLVKKLGKKILENKQSL